MAMDDKGGMSGYSKPKNNPNSKEKIAARKAARKESGMSAQKFFVQTRMAEAAKRGKTLDRAALRKQFQSGDVARKGFGAPKKKMSGSGSSSTGSSSTSSSAGRKAYGGVPQKAPKTNLSSGGKYMQSADTREAVPQAYARNRAKDVGDSASRRSAMSGAKSTAKKAPVSTASKGTAMRSADAYGTYKGPLLQKSSKRFKSKYDNSPGNLEKAARGVGGFLKGIQNDSGTRYVNGVKVTKKK